MNSGAGAGVTFLGTGAEVKKSDSDHLWPWRKKWGDFFLFCCECFRNKSECLRHENQIFLKRKSFHSKNICETKVFRKYNCFFFKRKDLDLQTVVNVWLLGQVFATFATFFTASNNFLNTQNTCSSMFWAVSRVVILQLFATFSIFACKFLLQIFSSVAQNVKV